MESMKNNMMKLKLEWVLFSFFIIALMTTGCAVKIHQTASDYAKDPIKPPKEEQVPEKIPYTVQISVNKSRELTTFKNLNPGSITTTYPAGAILDDAVKYYLNPVFTGEEYKNIIINIDAVDIKEDAFHRKGFHGCSTVKVSADIFIDNLRASLPIYSTGEGCSDKLTGAYGISVKWATVDAVKKLRKDIYESLMFLEKQLNLAKAHIKQHPNDFTAFVALANLSRLTKNYDEAIAAAKRSIELNPNDSHAYALLGLIYQAQKKYKESVENLRKAIALDSKFLPHYFKLVTVYEEIENYNEAINTLKKSIEIEPNNVGLYSKLTYSYMAAGRFDDAVKVINKVVQDIYVIKGIGTTIQIEEKYPVVKDLIPSGPAKKAGIEVGDRIIKINGQSTKELDINKVTENIRGQEGTQVTLTIERKGVDKPLEKIVTREKMITAGAATALGMRSLINAIKNNFGEARKDAEKAYSLNPNNGWARGALSFAYIIESPPLAKEGKITEAIKILSGTKNNFDRLLEALAYSKMGDLKKSFDIYTSIPEEYLQSKNVFRQQFRNVVLESLAPYVEDKKKSAKSLEAKGQYRDALKEYVEILKIAEEKEAKEIRSHVAMLIKARPDIAQLPEQARKHALRAEVATKEGKFADAIREYKEALKISPFFPQIYKAQALNYEALKDYKQAITNLKIYLELYPDAPDAREAKDQIYKWEFMLEKGGN